MLYYRTDFPATDDDGWLVNIAQRRVAGGEQIRRLPVALTRLRPREVEVA